MKISLATPAYVQINVVEHHQQPPLIVSDVIFNFKQENTHSVQRKLQWRHNLVFFCLQRSFFLYCSVLGLQVSLRWIRIGTGASISHRTLAACHSHSYSTLLAMLMGRSLLANPSLRLPLYVFRYVMYVRAWARFKPWSYFWSKKFFQFVFLSLLRLPVESIRIF